MTLGREQILVVDDDCVTLDLLTLHLEQAGFEVLACGSGLRSLSILSERQPRIVICDWLMPGLDGIEILRHVRALPGESMVYFIMLTVQADKHRLMEAFDAGVDDFLCKPFHEGELLARVRAGVRLVRSYDQLNQRQEALSRTVKELSHLNEKLCVAATTDELTRLQNRRQAMTRLRELHSLWQRSGQPLSCAIIDVDHFKKVNDEHGHLKGDEILQRISSTLLKCIRSNDMVYRLGGEEFLILFPSQGVAEAHACAERCRALVEASIRLTPNSPPVTISVGVAELTRGMTSPDHLLLKADAAMYKAKESGRNAVVRSVA